MLLGLNAKNFLSYRRYEPAPVWYTNSLIKVRMKKDNFLDHFNTMIKSLSKRMGLK